MKTLIFTLFLTLFFSSPIFAQIYLPQPPVQSVPRASYRYSNHGTFGFPGPWYSYSPPVNRTYYFHHYHYGNYGRGYGYSYGYYPRFYRYGTWY